MGKINLKDLDRYEDQSQKPQKIKKRKVRTELEQTKTTNKKQL
jgi:hypothetical protein